MLSVQKKLPLAYSNYKQMIHDLLLDDVNSKWNNIRRYMTANGYDGCLLSIDVNIFYVTGCIFNGYFYLPADGDPLFFVKRPNGYEGNGVFYVRKPEQIADYFAEHGIRKPEALLLEADELSYNEYIRLQAIFNPSKTGNATTMMRQQRMIKTPWELEQVRISALKHSETYKDVPKCYKAGMTDLEFQYEIERLMRVNGSIGIFRAFGTNMDIFMGSILAGDNAEAPSPFDFALGGAGTPSAPIGANGTLLEEGMSVMVDMVGNYTPYLSDMTRTFSVGKLSDLAYHAHQVSIDICRAVEANVTAGYPAAEVYNLAYAMAEREGLSSNFMGTKLQAKFVGHGTGLQINELPVFTPRSRDVMAEGMVVALEPKFVIPEVGAVGIENTYIMSTDGLERITLAEESIIELQNTI